MFTYRLITQGQLDFDAVVDRFRDANTTSLRRLFYTSLDIDFVALDPISLFNYIPQADAHPKSLLRVSGKSTFLFWSSSCTSTAQRTASTTLPNSV